MRTQKRFRKSERGLRYEHLESRCLLAAGFLPIELISTGNPDDPAAQVGNGASIRPSISADGRYVAFRSTADNLVANDLNGFADFFRKDLQTGALELVSVSAEGQQSDGQATFAPSISGNGRYVAFSSRATNLVKNDRNGNVNDVFVKDMQTGKVTLASVTANQRQSESGATSPVISSDGRFVAFVGGPFEGVGGEGVYRKDLKTNKLELVAEGWTLEINMSADGKVVLYTEGFFLGPLWARNMTTGESILVSAEADGTRANGASFPGAASADGRYVVFGSYATNLVTPDLNGTLVDLFVKDLWTGDIQRMSDPPDGSAANDWSPWGSLSADGRYVVFESDASNLVENDTNGLGSDVFVRDLWTNELIIVSNTEQPSADARSFSRPVISADGRFVAFDSRAAEHVPGDTNNTYDVFRVDLANAWSTMALGLWSPPIQTGEIAWAGIVTTADIWHRQWIDLELKAEVKGVSTRTSVASFAATPQTATDLTYGHQFLLTIEKSGMFDTELSWRKVGDSTDAIQAAIDHLMALDPWPDYL